MRRETDEHGESVFTARLRVLLEEIHQVDDRGRARQFANSYVAERTGLSTSYIEALRKGQKTNPGLNVLTKLATFFNEHRAPESPRITVSYLAGDADDHVEGGDDALLERLSDDDLREIAIRARGANPGTRQQILAMIKVLEQPGSSEGAAGSSS